MTKRLQFLRLTQCKVQCLCEAVECLLSFIFFKAVFFFLWGSLCCYFHYTTHKRKWQPLWWQHNCYMWEKWRANSGQDNMADPKIIHTCVLIVLLSQWPFERRSKCLTVTTMFGLINRKGDWMWKKEKKIQLLLKTVLLVPVQSFYTISDVLLLNNSQWDIFLLFVI